MKLTKLLPFLSLVFLSVGCAHVNERWTHLELGAGNYGLDGHTKVSQRKTVLKQLTYVSPKPNYVDALPEKDFVNYVPNHQYRVLFDTLDKMVERNGPAGVFHINDLYPEYAERATEQTKIYAADKGYNDVEISTIPGDYALIDATQTLAPYGKSKYDSVHLKNVEVSFFNHGMDGDQMITSAETRQKTRALLQKLANLSAEGLFFFPLDIGDFYLPKEEREEFIAKGQFYLPTDKWTPVAYYFPEGKMIPRELFSRLYFIKSQG